MKRFPNNPGDVLGVLNQVMVLGDRARHLHHRRFLEGVGADHVPGNLARHGDSGTESILASARPVTRLSAPGPEVAMTTPGLPVARA